MANASSSRCSSSIRRIFTGGSLGSERDALEGHTHAKDTAAPGRGSHCDLASMQLDRCSGNRQSQSAALYSPAGRSLSPIQPLEDPLAITFGNARTVIFYTHHRLTRPRLEAHTQAAAF